MTSPTRALATVRSTDLDPDRPLKSTNAENQAKHRRKYGGRQLQMTMPPDVAAATIYLRKQWGFRSVSECAQVAILHLCVETRLGLKQFKLTID